MTTRNRLGLTASAEFGALYRARLRLLWARWYERLAPRRRDAYGRDAYGSGSNASTSTPSTTSRSSTQCLLAPLRVDDDEAGGDAESFRVVAAYLDILIHRRIWNWRAIDYSTMQYAMFRVMKEFRGKSAPDLAHLLRDWLDDEEETFAANDRFHLHGANGRLIHRLLARMTDYVEVESGMASHYAEYAQRGRKGYEIEHVWADHYERHTDEFTHPSDFQEYRNRIGGLLLLPKTFNASYGDLPYTEKRQHYLKRNLLAGSLHEGAYSYNPGFKRFIETSGLPFRAHGTFKKADIDARQDLYQQLAEQIWSPDRLLKEAEVETSDRSRPR